MTYSIRKKRLYNPQYRDIDNYSLFANIVHHVYIDENQMDHIYKVSE